MKVLWLVLLCCPPGVATDERLESAGRNRPAADGVELVVLGPSELTRLRIRIERGGVPLDKCWREALTALFRDADRSGDGLLDRTEARRLPTGLDLRLILAGNLAPAMAGGPPWDILDADASGTVSAFELAEYFCREGLGGALVSGNAFTGSPALNHALRRAIDTNQNGRLEETEWTAFAASRGKFDANDDELIQATELVAGLDYPGPAFGPLLAPLPSENAHEWSPLPLAVLPPDRGNEAWANSLLRRLDQNGDRQLTRNESRLPADRFQSLDRDADGRLTATELVAWRETPPACNIVLELDEAASGGKEPPTFVGSDIIVQFRTTDGQSTKTVAAACAQLREEFSAADRDLDGIITAGDVAAAGQLGRVLPLADASGDNQLTRDELHRWLELTQQLSGALPLLTIVDAGSGLFQQLDANRDAALSVRELRGGYEQLTSSGVLVNGQFDERKSRRPVQISASLGRPDSSPVCSHLDPVPPGTRGWTVTGMATFLRGSFWGARRHSAGSIRTATA